MGVCMGPDKKSGVLNHFSKYNTYRPGEYPVEVRSGKSYALIEGRWYEVAFDRHASQFEILIESRSGDVKRHPVYLELLSKTWHFFSKDGNPAFSSLAIDAINRLAVPLDLDFEYVEVADFPPEAACAGRLYAVKRRGANTHGDNIHHWVAELFGQLVPVRAVRDGGAVRYEAFHRVSPDGVGYPIDWDGRRWLMKSK